MGRKALWKRQTSSADDWKVLGIIGAGRSTGVTHLSVWMANYLTGVRREQTAVLEWNRHRDFEKMERFYKGKCGQREGRFLENCLEKIQMNAGSGKEAGKGKKGSYCRILNTDYYGNADAETMAQCLNGKYRRILVDYGEMTGESFCECTRCDRKILVGGFSDWQTEAFLEAVRMIPDHDESWQYAAVFGSERTRKEWEKVFRMSCMAIPSSVDAFMITADDMRFFKKLLF